MPKLTDPVATDPDSLYTRFTSWAEGQGIELYPHQDESAIELFTGNNLILSTPTGSGKSLVALAGHFAALATDRVSFYTAPIKALVSEKFFALCQVFGAENVGMVTGDASVNSDAPIICCTAEVLANIALREGGSADVGLVIADEFHFYSEPDRGWAWQVPLLELPQAQFLLMSATLGDVSALAENLSRRTGRPTSLISDAERPVPLLFEWSRTPLQERLVDLIQEQKAPVYIVHFTQAEALERAQALLSLNLITKHDSARIAEEIGAFRFGLGFGKILSGLVRRGIGVHHAGMLPKYRRLVEQLAQTGLLKVICGTDTLGVGINVPIRTVLFTGLAKYDGTRVRRLRSREFHQIAGRAGRAGFDTVGFVVVQAPEHVIENERALAKAGDDPKARRKVVRRKPPEGFIGWTEETFDRIVVAQPEQLVSRMQVTHATVLNIAQRPGNGAESMRALLGSSHETADRKRVLTRHALALTRALLRSGVLVKLAAPDLEGRWCAMAEGVRDDFALNQPLAPFAVASLALLDPDSPTHHLDVVSIIEAVLEDPFQVVLAQQFVARGEAVAQMKADGVEYDERMERLEEITWPKPLDELLQHAMGIYAQSHPWVDASALSPKAVVRDMWERAMNFNQFISFYKLQRTEGGLLRYLSDAYRALRHTVPDEHRSEQFEDLVEWLGETVRQTDSSLLDEWEALTDPDKVALAAEAAAHGAPPPPPRPVTGNERAFTAMIRTAMFRRVELAARDDVDALAALETASAALADPPLTVLMDADAWDSALAGYWDEHDDILTDGDARGPGLFRIEKGRERWTVLQVIHDPAGNHDWMIRADADLAASDAAGAAVVRAASFSRLD
ncbi:DEAD/DEAH box helicase [Tessaracoccus sp. Z1128]